MYSKTNSRSSGPARSSHRGAPSHSASSSAPRRSYSSSPSSAPAIGYAPRASSGGRPAYGYASSSRPSFGGSRGGYAGGGSRGGFSGGYSNGPRRFGGGRGRGFSSGPKIDVSRYINKGAKKAEVVAYIPKHKFADFQINDRLKANIIEKGYELPTPIQDQTIPLILEGKDVVGIANTGTGKTAAFLIPLINKIMKGIDEKRNEQVIIVAPTRELAIQIDDELKMFTKGLKIFSVCVVGGSPIGRQISELRYHNDFIIGTPGRIKDLMERNKLDLSTFKTVVLDEADRMLDMGFIADMKYMMSKMSADRHTLFFSATLSSEIEKLIKDFLNNPVRVSVKTQDTSKNIEQDVIRASGSAKMQTLEDLLSKDEFEKVLVFGKTKHGVQRISDTLSDKGFKAVSIHGDKNQTQRQRALADFKQNRMKILVATDVAARGLDIPDVSHVINYDLPATHEDYIHRIGRTGRGNKTGKALTFID
jgi:ATP-dependent RNA helicase RhlE